MVLSTLLSNIESPTASPLHVLFSELVRVRDHDTDGQKHIEETEWHHPCTATEGYTMDSFERAPRMPCFEVEAILHMMMIVYYNRCDRVVSQTHPITKIVPRWTSYRRLMKAVWPRVLLYTQPKSVTNVSSLTDCDANISQQAFNFQEIKSQAG
ncbi:hypothetical protein, variant [Phytophthora nicotianae P10297]|uniref:Uncharacterized protein n=1 Tax=Phytophthora nicotianae P10297 TaxID=1317064 RepID=W3A0B4_PHYNI|nr:hypothetical protein, variant [Phytophthora nicotianae P10297]